MSERDIFDAALAIDDPAQRAAYLDSACAGNAELREHIEGLLSVHGQVGSFLQSPAAALIATADEPITERPGTVIGAYKLMEQIGEGGMGLVFVAEQQHPVRRKVALKVMKPGMDTREVIARFEAERQALALMDHPHIAKVLDGGATASGRPYFVMELVKGPPITDFCDQNQLPVRARLELFFQVCMAVQHAHQKGIIHRDLKPSNVLVASHDGKPVVRVIDFGVAKAVGQQLTDRTVYTRFAQLVGTPLYMSPEQAGLSSLDIDTRSDIYSLGVLLYELLTGTTPFDKERFKEVSHDEIRRIICEEEPPKPSTRISTLGQAGTTISTQRKSDPKRLSQIIRGELDWIVMKCLEKERDRRYETANGLARDIERYLRDEPVQACSPSAMYRLRKFARRHKAGVLTATLLSAVLILAVIGLTISIVLISDALEQVRLKDREKSDKLWRALLAEAQANRWNGRAGRRFDSLNKLAEAAAIAQSLQVSDSDILKLRNEVIACQALPDLRVSKAWQFQKGDPTAHADFREYVNPEHVCFDANLEHYAAVDYADGNIRLHSVKDDQEIARLTNPRMQAPGLNIRLMGFSPDGRLLGVIYAGSEVLIWEWRRQAIVFQKARGKALIPEPDYSALDWSGDGRKLALGRRDGAITIFDADSGQVLKEFGSLAQLKQLAWHPDGNELAVLTSANNGTVVLYDIRNGTSTCAFEHPAALHRIAWRHDGRFLAVGSEDKNVYISDVPARRAHSVLKAHQGSVIQMAFSHGGNLLATLGWDSTLRLWNPWTGKELVSCPVFGGRLQFSADDQFLSVTLSDGRLAILDVVTGPAFRTLYCPSGASGLTQDTTVWGIDFSPDGRLLAATEKTAGIRLWDLASRREPALALVPQKWSSSVAFEPSGRSLLTGGVDRWPIAPEAGASDTLRIGPPEHLGSPDDSSGVFSLSDDGQTLAIVHWGQARGTVRNLSHPTDWVELRPHEGIRHTAVSPDGRWVATGPHRAGWTKVWDARTGRLVRDLRGEGAWIGFSPDGQWLVVGELVEYVFWRVGSWESGLRIPRGAPVNIGYFAFVRDGTCLAIVPRQYEVRLVDPITGQEFATLTAPEPQEIFALMFSPDGSQLAAGTSTNMIQLWDLRVLRRQLAALNLDWGLPPYAEPTFSDASEPLRITVVDKPQKSGVETKEMKEKASK